jgi:hypothetical protein
MDLIILVIVLSVIGFLVWAITTKIPMDPIVKLAIQVIAAAILVLYALRQLHILPNVL